MFDLRSMLAQATAAKRRAGAEPIGLIMTPNTFLRPRPGLGGSVIRRLAQAAQYASLLRPTGSEPTRSWGRSSSRQRSSRQVIVVDGALLDQLGIAGRQVRNAPFLAKTRLDGVRVRPDRGENEFALMVVRWAGSQITKKAWLTSHDFNGRCGQLLGQSFFASRLRAGPEDPDDGDRRAKFV